MPKRVYRSRAWWEATRLALLIEQQSRCPWCGRAFSPYDEVASHHRRRRLGRDDDDDQANLLLLHGDCHREVHNSPAASRRDGFIVSTWDDFREVAKPS